MKKKLLNIFALLLFLSCFSINAFGLTRRYCTNSQIDNSNLIHGGDGFVWPWGQEALFPWKSVQGFWTTENDQDCPHYFFFKLTKGENNKKYMKITKYNPFTCKILAIGFATNTDKQARVIEGSLNQQKGEPLYLSVHVFNDSEKSHDFYNENDDILVINFKDSKNSTIANDNAYSLRRLNLNSNKVCSPNIFY